MGLAGVRGWPDWADCQSKKGHVREKMHTKLAKTQAPRSILQNTEANDDTDTSRETMGEKKQRSQFYTDELTCVHH